jgi:hypothetical protein
MSIGIGIFLIMLGAVLTFAVDWSIGGLDLQAVGWILMVAGVGGLVMFFYLWNRRRVPQAVTVLRQRQTTDVPRAYDDPTPLPAVTTVMSPRPQPVTVTPPLPPAQVTTVTATAPVAVSSQGRPESAER